VTVNQFAHIPTVVVLISGISSSTFAAPLPTHGVFYYSSQCFDPNGGDSGGNFVKLTRAPQGDSIEFGWSDEGPLMSVAATNVHIEPDGPHGTSKIRFSIPPTPYTVYAGETRKFVGSISTSEVRLSGLEVPMLPRRFEGSKPERCP
jgi:hypothetical protein